LFQPRSIAVVGASRNPAHLGHRLLQALLQGHFRGDVYPVNPCAASIAGLRCYPTVQAIPGPVDLAVVVTPPETVLSVADDCAAKKVPALLVVTAGFAEVGGGGERLQAQLLDRVRAAGMRMLGPNCLGLLNTDPETSLNVTFVNVSAPRGHAAMSSDSGALGLALLTAAARLGLGISSCVSVGNRADVSSNDLLEFWETDPDTSLILLYLESFGNPRRFSRIARRVTRRKPVVAIKAGRTRAGRRAAGSHTAALAASDQAVDALFHQTGVLRVATLEEMFDLASGLSLQPLPCGRRVGVVTNAGGPGILCADACEAGGLVLPELSSATRAEFASWLPAGASLANPIDLLASATPEQFHRSIRTLVRSGEVDALLVIHVNAEESLTEHFRNAIVAGAVESGARTTGIPVLACVMAADEVRSLGEGPERIPCYTYPEAAARVLGRMASYAEWRVRPEGQMPRFADLDIERARAVCREALAARAEDWLSAAETRLFLRALRFEVPPGGVAADAEEAVELARAVGFPVAVKLASRRLTHKTEVGGVHLDLKTEDDVRRAFAAIVARLAQDQRLDAMDGVLVQPMVKGGTELLVGVTQDPLFGPLIAFGLGGIHVEILGDVCFRVAPLTDRDAAEMVRGIRGFKLLEGYRGHPSADVPALEELLLRVSQLVEQIPEVVEMDLNPVIALPPGQGSRTVDARIRVAPAPHAC
jgi:acyl-CoA synthetase (NDP forming)